MKESHFLLTESKNCLILNHFSWFHWYSSALDISRSGYTGDGRLEPCWGGKVVDKKPQ